MTKFSAASFVDISIELPNDILWYLKRITILERTKNVEDAVRFHINTSIFIFLKYEAFYFRWHSTSYSCLRLLLCRYSSTLLDNRHRKNSSCDDLKRCICTFITKISCQMQTNLFRNYLVLWDRETNKKYLFRNCSTVSLLSNRTWII